VDEAEINRRILNGTAAIKDEVMALGNKVVIEQFYYILQQKASEKKFPNGIQDKGHKGMRLKDFVSHQSSRVARLTEAEVVALQLYTTAAFKHINTPLCDMICIKKGIEHPLPVTVALITRGIKKLRALDADSATATQSQMLWRGLKQIRQTDYFAERGGTEVCDLFKCSVCIG
jgi:hypothetical protein